MTFAKDGLKWLANVYRQSIPQLQAQGDSLRRQYYLLSDQMNTLAQGTTGWEGQASAVCEQLWEDLGPKLILQVAALNELSDALGSLATEFEHIHDNPSQAAAEMGLPVAGLSLGGALATDGAIGAGISAAEFLTAGLVTIVIAGVVIYVTEQQEEQNAITATQQVVATTTTAPDSVATATKSIPFIDDLSATGGQGDPGPSSSNWPYYVIGMLVVGGIASFIAYEKLHGQGPSLPDEKQISQIAGELASTYSCSKDSILNIIDNFLKEYQQRSNQSLTKAQLKEIITRLLKSLQIKSQEQAIINDINQKVQDGELSQQAADSLKQRINDHINGDIYTRNPETLTDPNMGTLDGDLKGDWGEYQAALQLQLQQVSQIIRPCAQIGGNPFELDGIQGNTWIEVKNQDALTPGSGTFDEAITQFVRDIKVGTQCYGINNYQLVVPMDQAGINDAVLRERLRAAGIDPNRISFRVTHMNFGSPPGPVPGWC